FSIPRLVCTIWTSPTLAMKGPLNRCTMPQWVLILLLMIFLSVGLFVLLHSSPRSVMVLRVPYEISKPKPAWLQRLSGPLRPWWWRFKSWVWGPPRGITLDAEVIDCTESIVASWVRGAVGDAEFADTNGLQVWRLGTNELKTVRRHLEQTPGNIQLSRPRVTT